MHPQSSSNLPEGQFKPEEADLLKTEYTQLLEEIREGGRLSWAPWTTYLAATAAILGALTQHLELLFPVSLPMAGLGVLVILNIFKIRRLNDYNYLRIWDIEARWQRVVGPGLVGSRWNPFANQELSGRLGHRSLLRGLVDWSLILATAITAAVWLGLAIIGIFQVSAIWYCDAAAVVPAVVVAVVVSLLLRSSGLKSEKSASEDWKKKHEDLRPASE